MFKMVRFFSLLASMGAAALLPAAAGARSGAALWSERTSGSPPLAQVPDFRSLAGQLIPAVVSIQVEQRIKVGRPGPGRQPMQDPFDFFYRYFGGDMPREYSNRGLGTGFIIDAAGYILTNNHVIENADLIEVTFTKKEGGEKTVTAKVLGTAPEYDVALLKTDEDLRAPVAYLGDSDQMQIGDWVMAVGNPFGLSHSVSVGIISAKERREVMPSGRRGLYNFLQTDASINPGNSGGPLINMRGEVIGINTAINAAGSGIGFAIPINMVKTMIPDLKTKGRYARSWIGVRIQPLTQDLAESYGLKNIRGALVAEVIPNSPAAKADLQEGDVIVEFGGKELTNATDLTLFAAMAGVGHVVDLKYWRDGKVKSTSVKLEEFPDDALAEGGPDAGQRGELGLVIADITPELQRKFGLEVPSGVVVKDIEPGSLAARAGLRPGDVILGVNGLKILAARGFVEIIRKTEKGALLRLTVLRQDTRLLLAFRKP